MIFFFAFNIFGIRKKNQIHEHFINWQTFFIFPNYFMIPYIFLELARVPHGHFQLFFKKKSPVKQSSRFLIGRLTRCRPGAHQSITKYPVCVTRETRARELYLAYCESSIDLTYRGSTKWAGPSQKLAVFRSFQDWFVESSTRFS